MDCYIGHVLTTRRVERVTVVVGNRYKRSSGGDKSAGGKDRRDESGKRGEVTHVVVGISSLVSGRLSEWYSHEV